jgi:hypothetical protein
MICSRQIPAGAVPAHYAKRDLCMNRLPFLLAALLSLCVLLAVQAAPARSAPAPHPESLVVTVVADKATYNRGEPVQFVLSVMNTEPGPDTIPMPTGQTYDFIVRTLDGSEVWRWSRDRLFTQAAREVAFAPGETKRFSETWDQRTNTGQQVGPGSYVVIGVYASSPEVRSSLVGFSIVTPAYTVTPTVTMTPVATGTPATTATPVVTATPNQPSRGQWLNRPPLGPDAAPACPSSGQWLQLYWGGDDGTPIAAAANGCTTITLLTFPPQYVCGDGSRASEAGRCPEADLYWVYRGGRWLGFSQGSPDVSDTWTVLRGEAHFLHGGQ